MIQIISRTQSITSDGSADLADVRRELRRAARLETVQQVPVVVSFSITFSAGAIYGRARQENVTVSLYRDRGQRPSLVLAEVEGEESLRLALRKLAGRRQDVSQLGHITHVEMTLTPPRPDTRRRAA